MSFLIFPPLSLFHRHQPLTTYQAATTCPANSNQIQQNGISVCCPYATRWDDANIPYCCVGVDDDNDARCGLFDACGHDIDECNPLVAVDDPEYSSRVFGTLAEATAAPTPSSSSSIGGGDDVVTANATTAASSSTTTYTDGALPTGYSLSFAGGVTTSTGTSVSAGVSQSVSAGASQGVSESVSGSANGSTSTSTSISSGVSSNPPPAPTSTPRPAAGNAGDNASSSASSSTSTSTGGATVPTQAPLLGLAVGAGIAAAGWYGF
ncbi:hypothetical protein K449DRAFT_3285 [Hypoxylon sp. EC38]|nr:hypothetical protein K449DRAFT_3285 [Hypoxylon sp. EC38]